MRAVSFLLPLILFSISAQADVLNFSWTANTDTTEGYYLYLDSGNIPALTLSGRETTTAQITMEQDGACHNFWLRAYAGGLESRNSDIAVWCPVSVDPPSATQPPVSVGGFTISIVVEPN